jgi:hypothetical protein
MSREGTVLALAPTPLMGGDPFVGPSAFGRFDFGMSVSSDGTIMLFVAVFCDASHNRFN